MTECNIPPEDADAPGEPATAEIGSVADFDLRNESVRLTLAVAEDVEATADRATA